ncbi:MAG: YdeI/OmpD-associated family protein [Candidatus Sericytochromatia bacterium]|nr:YdeI/OmpD-associated family protein [Candidatus Sericytochromatia bacterium]
MNNTNVESYLAEGCGRCDKFRTPDCKVHRWTDALSVLRAIVRRTGLEETMKWGSPCYTLAEKNVVMLTAMKDSCALSFLKGAALPDPDGLLERPGPNSRIGRLVKFASLAEVEAKEEAIIRLIEAAVAFERTGGKMSLEALDEVLPIELSQRLEEDPVLDRAFAALTPGRRRSHILHISGAKQVETRARRVERCIPDILAGKGHNER